MTAIPDINMKIKINYCFNLFTLLSVYITTISCSANPKECTKELEGIIYHPPNPAYNYLARLTDELVAQLAPLQNPFFSPQSAQIILNFAVKYDVRVSIQSPFPRNLNSIPNYSKANGIAVTFIFRGHLVAPTYLNQRGFDLQFGRYRMATYIQLPLDSATIAITTPAARATYL